MIEYLSREEAHTGEEAARGLVDIDGSTVAIGPADFDRSDSNHIPIGVDADRSKVLPAHISPQQECRVTFTVEVALEECSKRQVEQHVAGQDDTSLARSQEIRSASNSATSPERVEFLGEVDLELRGAIRLDRGANRLWQMVKVDHDLFTAVVSQEFEQQADDRSAPHGKGGFGAQVTERAHAGAQASRENHRPHRKSLSFRAISIPRLALIALAPGKNYRVIRPPL